MSITIILGCDPAYTKEAEIDVIDDEGSFQAFSVSTTQGIHYLPELSERDGLSSVSTYATVELSAEEFVEALRLFILENSE